MLIKNLLNYRRNKNKHFDVIRKLRAVEQTNTALTMNPSWDRPFSYYLFLFDKALHTHPAMEVFPRLVEIWIKEDSDQDLAGFMADKLEARTRKVLLWGRV